jgi:hypothetical protein
VSKCQRASNAAMISRQMIGHAACRNLAVNLSGPKALLGGRELMTDQTSCSMKRSPNCDSFSYGSAKNQS